jgi:hypothetical protein
VWGRKEETMSATIEVRRKARSWIMSQAGKARVAAIAESALKLEANSLKARKIAPKKLRKPITR